MVKDVISYSSTGYFQRLFLDYVSGKSSVESFYSFSPDYDGLSRALTNQQFSDINRKVLCDSIEEQYNRLCLKDEKYKNLIAQLRQNNTYTVCTGHQLCTFTGPLYFIYKIITTIRLSEELKKRHTDKNFIPVYWMASEDHDFEEVNHIKIFGEKLEWQTNDKGAVGDIRVDEVQSIIDQFANHVKGLPHADKIISLLRDCYKNGSTLSDATFRLVNELFKNHDLLIIDPDNKKLKSLFSEQLLSEAFTDKNDLLVGQASERMKSYGYEPQINSRKTNLFYKLKGLRERIIKEDESFIVNHSDKVFDTNSLRNEIENYPERFSPNVVLRPLYQQTILPNIAYIGGGAEVSYWLQLKDMFDESKVFFPVVLGRNSALIADKQSIFKLEKLGLSVHDLFEDMESLSKRYIEQFLSNDFTFKLEEKEMDSMYAKIESMVEKVDPTLKATVNGELQKAFKGLDNIRSKVIKAEKNKQEVSINQLKKIREKLFPNGSLQERHENIMVYLCMFGHEFIETLCNELDPFNEFTIIKTA